MIQNLHFLLFVFFGFFWKRDVAVGGFTRCAAPSVKDTDVNSWILYKLYKKIETK